MPASFRVLEGRKRWRASVHSYIRVIAARVNLLPGERPNDLYQAIADKAKHELDARAPRLRWYADLPFEALLEKYDVYGERMSALYPKKTKSTGKKNAPPESALDPDVTAPIANDEEEEDTNDLFESNNGSVSDYGSGAPGEEDTDEDAGAIDTNLEPEITGLSALSKKRIDKKKRKLHGLLAESRRQISMIMLHRLALDPKSPLTVDRKLLKNAVMTFPYSATHSGNAKNIEEMLLERGLPKDAKPSSARDGKATVELIVAHALTRIVRRVIDHEMKDAVAAMKYLKELLPNDPNRPAVRWTAPSDLKVTQRYFQKKDGEGMIKLEYSGRRFFMFPPGEEGPADLDHHRRAIAPNFVHAMDAAHLVKTVNAVVPLGVDSFLMIHDSYGTHAADMEKLAKALREQFAAVYQTDWLDRFRVEALEQRTAHSKPLPPSMPAGDLAVGAVLDSDYFFS